MWAGSHHLHYTALPHWVQNLGMTFSVMLLVPSWASAGNALLTLNGAWHKVRDDATLRFMMAAVVFYGLVDVRRVVPGDTPGQFAFPLYGLDNRPRACRSARLGGADHLRLPLHAHSRTLETRADVFGHARRGALLARDRGDPHLRLRDVELRNYPRPDVAHLHGRRDAGLFLRQLAGRHVSVLHRARFRRPSVPAWNSSSPATTSG